MKVTIFYQPEGSEVDVDLNADDINLIFSESGDFANPDIQRVLMCNLNKAITFFKGIPVELAQNAMPEVKSIVIKELKAAMEKFES